MRRMRGLRTESGVTSIEYAFIAMLVAIGLVTALGVIGQQLKVPLTKVGNGIEAANK